MISYHDKNSGIKLAAVRLRDLISGIQRMTINGHATTNKGLSQKFLKGVAAGFMPVFLIWKRTHKGCGYSIILLLRQPQKQSHLRGFIRSSVTIHRDAGVVNRKLQSLSTIEEC